MTAIDRRAALAGFAAGLALPALGRAQGWPGNRTIKVVCPFPPAGATDVLARLMAQRLAESWGTNVIVEVPG